MTRIDDADTPCPHPATYDAGQCCGGTCPTDATPTPTTAAPDPVKVAREAAANAVGGNGYWPKANIRDGRRDDIVEVRFAILGARAMQEAMSAQGGGEPTPKQLRDAYAYSDLICPTTHSIEAEMLGVWRFLNGQVARPAPEVKDAPAEAVKVKPLVWEPADRRHAYGRVVADARSVIGRFEVVRGSQGIYEVYFGEVPVGSGRRTSAEAQADGDEDFARRIRSALDLATPQVGAGVCDCERSHNGIGLAGRECDCQPTTPAPAASDELVERLRREDEQVRHDCEHAPQKVKVFSTLAGEAAARIEADAAEMERKDARIWELANVAGQQRGRAERAEARATAAEAEREVLKAKESLK